MNFESPNLPKPKDGEIVDKVERLEKIETPEELLSFMGDNLSYGFVGRNNKKIYSAGDKEMKTDFDGEYYLQTPKESLESGHGVCWDMTELERDWFSKKGYNPKVFFMLFVKEGGTDLPTHTFLVYELDSKWYWFENSFADNRGIHEYASQEELMEDVKKKQLEYSVKYRGAKPEDMVDLKIIEFSKPMYGASPNEFVSKIIKDNPSLMPQ